MTPRQIRLGLAGLSVIIGSVSFNLLAMQPDEARNVRPQRAYRGLDALPGTPSSSIKDRVGTAASTGAVTGKSRVVVTEAAAATTADAPPAGGAAAGAQAALTRSIQHALADRGYAAGDSDGAIDVVTRAAIMAFEEDYGLPLTAEPSKSVLDALRTLREPMKVAASQAVRPGPEAEGLIRTVQQTLEGLDYRPGVADGRLGEATASAIRNFEKTHGLAPTGRITAPLLTKLAERARADRIAARDER
jgi:peptidoglycan hydrolase-like protein with peptidoglycan-binding domain